MLILSLQIFSITKQSGAFISSRLIAPKVGSKETMISANLSGLFSLISISKQSIPANFLNNTALPSMTGLAAKAPILPNPKTAVPFEITATKFDLDV